MEDSFWSLYFCTYVLILNPSQQNPQQMWRRGKYLQFDSEHGGKTDFYVQMVFQVQLNPVRPGKFMTKPKKFLESGRPKNIKESNRLHPKGGSCSETLGGGGYVQMVFQPADPVESHLTELRVAALATKHRHRHHRRLASLLGQFFCIILVTTK